MQLLILEGFIRQIIGWREFIRGVYIYKGKKERTTNFWKFNKDIPTSFYEANTGIEPIDTTIKKLVNTAYNHHIERLMILGNFMLLCEIDPNEVFKWFMLTIDAYQWVMVPNIFGMSQYADGGLLMTRPYFSSSNYIMRMSDYKAPHANIEIQDKMYSWAEIWDALYYRFIYKNHDMLKKIYATARNVAHWDKKSKKDQDDLLELADKYLKFLHK